MSDCLEVLFVSDRNEQLQSACCFDPHIGTTLVTYRGGNGSSKNCLNIIKNDYLVAVEESKSILQVWPLNSQEPAHDLKMVLPGKLSALSISHDGCYCVGGIDGKIYIWLISSGYLLKVISKHYQAINKIAFTDDSSHFVTAGEDGLVLVWSLADSVAKQSGDILRFQNNQITPIYNFSQHSLSVTDFYLGHGGLKARLFTVSIDQTCKIFCLSSGTLLLSLMYNSVLTSVNVNDLETILFLGTSSGNIQSINLDPYPRSLEHHISENNILGTFLGHTDAITCLSSSIDGKTLASGSKDEKIFIWNIHAKQVLRSFQMKGPVLNLFFQLVSGNIFSNKFNSGLVVSKFEKSNNKEDKHLEINVWIHENINPILFEPVLDCKNNKIYAVDPGNNKDDINVKVLQEEITKLKETNKQLYKFAMTKIIRNPLSVAMINESTGEIEKNV